MKTDRHNKKEPLYRKVNTKARGVHHNTGSETRYDRNTKKGLSNSLKQGVQRGLDYTPLFRFLLSKVGQDWDVVHQEAISRLDKEEPIFYMVDRQHEHDKFSEYDSFGYENSRWSKLIIDENNKLQLKNPLLCNEDFFPSCWCCTHTFNGTKLNKTYEDFNKTLLYEIKDKQK